jgi:hypothetical protein
MSERKIAPLHYDTLVKIFELIKTSPRLVPITHIRTNITTSGMTRDRFFELLEKAR